MLVIFGALGFTTLRLYSGLPTTNYEQYYVSTPLVGNLLSHDAVRISGKRIGQVLHIEIGSNGQPRVELQLDPGTRLPKDTRVRMRANGLLGARYVELVPGDSPELLREGATIEGDTASYTYGLPEAVDVFNKETRGGLQKTFGNLGAGMLANGAPLNPAIEDLARGPHEADQVARAILAREGAAERFFPSLQSGFDPLDRTRYAVGDFMQATGDAVTPFVTEREATQATLDQAPAALAAAEDGLRRGQALLTSVRSLAGEAALTLPPAPQAFTDLSALLEESRVPLRRAQPLMLAARGAVPGALKILRELKPVIPHAKAGIDTARPILETVGKHACDVRDAAATIRSFTGFGQAGSGPNGPAMGFRLQAIIPSGLEAVGVQEDTLLTRDSYEEPCKYLLKPYPQGGPPVSLARKSR